MAWVSYFLARRQPAINVQNLGQTIRRALKEDIGSSDLTSQLLIPKNKIVQAKIITREPCLLCGVEIAKKVFLAVNGDLKFIALKKDGTLVGANQVVATISGSAQSILKAERVALNFLGILSAVATKTRRFVKMAAQKSIKIIDTRKTIPGLRELQKYAVRIGGGYNHRFCLEEMVLIKDNHLKLMPKPLKFPKLPEQRKIEIEVENLGEFKRVLALHPDVIMLDNMKLSDIRQAVKIRNHTKNQNLILLEVSGGINFKNIKKYASTGVDLISIGELTDSLSAIDLSLEVI